MELTHASFFSGVGGLDRGLERAGFRTVSFSEIDPYASAVLAERWPGIPNLGDITAIAAGVRPDDGSLLRSERGSGIGPEGGKWHRASLWTGGFPCQDLSVAGKRAGMGTHADRSGTRSGLAYSFLSLVERYRPPAIVLENVPGLLSSHQGRDFYALQRRMAQLGYVGAYRVLDARYFGVPQRRRRVFIVALDAGRGFGPDSAAEVLSVGSRCRRHPPAGTEAWAGIADGVDDGADIVGTIPAGLGHHGNDGHSSQAVASGHVIPGQRPPPDASRVRAPDGLARGLDDREGLVNALDQRRGGADDNEAQAGHLVLSPTLRVGPAHIEDGGPGDTVPIVTAYNPYRTLERDGSVTSGYAERAVVDALHGPTGNKEPVILAGSPKRAEPSGGNESLLPLGLDSHRYRCCGNGVVSSVPEWFGQRLAALLS